MGPGVVYATRSPPGFPTAEASTTDFCLLVPQTTEMHHIGGFLMTMMIYHVHHSLLCSRVSLVLAWEGIDEKYRPPHPPPLVHRQDIYVFALW